MQHIFAPTITLKTNTMKNQDRNAVIFFAIILITIIIVHLLTPNFYK